MLKRTVIVFFFFRFSERVSPVEQPGKKAKLEAKHAFGGNAKGLEVPPVRGLSRSDGIQWKGKENYMRRDW